MYHMVMREVMQRAEQRKCKGDRERVTCLFGKMTLFLEDGLVLLL